MSGTGDAAARAAVVQDLTSTLFVDAGAGTGKTTALVGRVLALVEAGEPLSQIAVITFTEAAAAQLRHRVRDALEARARAMTDSDRRERIRAALEEADTAPISTLHAFAARVLREHPFDAGLPPRFEVADEVSSQLAFADRWRRFSDELYADPAMERPLVWAYLLGIKMSRSMGASLERVAQALDQSWDRLLGAPAEPRGLPELDRPGLRAVLAAVRGFDLDACCHDPSDGLALHLDDLRLVLARLDQLAEHGSDEELLATLVSETQWSRKVTNVGRKSSWDDIGAVRAALTTLTELLGRVRDDATNGVLRILTGELVRSALRAAEERTREGVLEFHDLLVLARELLRTNPRARAALHERYRRVLIDEFQDTDPLQVELAVLIASGVSGDEVAPSGVAGVPWDGIDAPAGRLFFVGDPKQSIYRFRRADIAVYLRARAHFAGDGALMLTRSYRSEPTVVAWINHVFGAVMGDGEDEAQPAYMPLEAARGPDADHDHRVVLLGGPHERTDGHPTAAELREHEAADVAGAIDAIRADPGAWAVVDPHSDVTRPARLDDITILVPTRLSLRYLRGALADRGIPHRVETGSLVFETPEVRDLVSVLRVLADPSDAISMVAALRSPAFACGDDDLSTYAVAGGRWDLWASAPDGLDGDHPVVRGLTYLRDLHAQHWWLEPGELLARIVSERGVLLLGFGQPRARDVWRRVHYLVDQARAFTESQGGDLLTFLAWVELASIEGSRVHEPVLAEPDDESVRIMTVHGAKGLEFPITIVAGTSTLHRNGGRQFSLCWSEDGRPEVALGKGRRTDDFDRLADLEGEMDLHEKQRLLYVATTRARDYLLVGAHHLAGRKSFAATVWQHSQTAPEPCCRTWDAADEPRASVPDPVTAPAATAATVLSERRAWIARRADALTRAARPRAVSATALVPDHAPDVVDLPARAGSAGGEAPLTARGRGGTGFGRAVHATLQTVDLGDPGAVDAIAAIQVGAEGLPPEAVVEVAAAVRRALAAPVVQRAVTRRFWREAYVAVPAADGIVEGYVDLLFEDDDGLVVVDYKTDRVAGEAAAREHAQHYRNQAAAYAFALERATGRPVVECVFVFARPEGAIEVSLPDLTEAVAEVEGLLEALRAG